MSAGLISLKTSLLGLLMATFSLCPPVWPFLCAEAPLVAPHIFSFVLFSSLF